MSPAPSSTRNASQRNRSSTGRGGGGPRVAQEDREEPRLEQQGFPAEPVELLADVDDREIQQPRGRARRASGARAARLGEGPAPAQRPAATPIQPSPEEAIGVVQVEQARRVAKAEAAKEAGGREQATLAQQRGELVQRAHEGEQVGQPEPALDHQPGQPVIRRGEPVHHPVSPVPAGAARSPTERLPQRRPRRVPPAETMHAGAGRCR